MKKIAWFAFGWLLIGTLEAASFDCRKTQTKIEKLICDSAQVSALDEELDKIYKTARQIADPAERPQLISEQKLWLIESRNKCGDEQCLLQAYSSRIEIIKAFHSADGREPLIETDVTRKSPAPIGKGFPVIFPSIDGDLVYSHYDDNGNTKSIVQFDFTTGHWANLIQGKKDPLLVAQNSKYIVFHTPHSASFPIEVVNRKTGVSLARIRLR